jgi:hypothetical protein
MIDGQTKVIAQVIQERRMQDRQWGGSHHDDSHDLIDWIQYMGYQATHIKSGDPKYRERLIKIAALAVAAIESLDRKAQP